MTHRLYLRVPSPLGEVTLVAEGGELLAVVLPEWDCHGHPVELGARVGGIEPALTLGSGDADASARVLRAAAHQLNEYFDGRRTTFDLPLRLDGTEWQRQVWQGLRDIPCGQTWTYGQLAAHVGRPSASRAVGAANGRNRLAIVVPCHRVVGVSGTLTGYAGGLRAKRWLLSHEAAHAPFVRSQSVTV